MTIGFPWMLGMVPLKQFVANPLVLILVITTGGLMLAGRMWDGYRSTLQQQAAYQLSLNNTRLTEAPSWLPEGVHAKILAQVTESGANLFEPELVVQVADSLQQNSWIEDIIEIRKSPSELRIDVRFGKPLLVELPDGKVALVNPRGEKVDAPGLSPEISRQVLRIAASDLVSATAALGQPWPDRRVTLATDLARQLASIHEAAGLAGIYGRYLDDSGPRRSSADRPEPSIEFRLWTVGRNEIIWGSPVGKEIAGEATAATKMAGLARYVQIHGLIDQGKDLPAARGNVLDLRSGELKVVRNAKQASEFFGSLR
ncbi:MAG: hypothetical protein JNL67_13335 [Planctomycetaceae bacterium]|nr:hypothetical protein [Planctomycetaceae bacterium]